MRVRFRTVLINLVILGLLLKVVDIYLGWEEPLPKPKFERVVTLREHLPLTTDSVVPHDNYLAKTEHLEKRPYMVRTDANGFVIGRADQVYDTTSVDILFLGGSTTACRFMNEEARFPYRVGMLLRHEGRPLRTLNAGHSGSHSVNSTFTLLAKGIEQQPRIVVMMHAVNDMVMLSMTGSYYKSPASRVFVKQIRTGSERLSFRPLKERFMLSMEGLLSIPFPHITVRLTHPFKPTELTDEWAAHRVQQGRVDMDGMLLLFERSLRTFVGVARANDMVPVLMTQPNRMLPTDSFVRNHSYPPDSGMPYDSACKHYARFNDRVREVAASEGVFLIELQRKIPPSSSYFYDGVHLTEAGSLMVADSIAAQLSGYFPSLQQMP